MLKSVGLRYFLIGLITLLMSVPLFFASTIVSERANYSRQTTEQLSREWGGAQSLNGAIMVLPVTGPEKRTKKRSVKDPLTGIVRTNKDGQIIYEEVEFEVIVHKQPLYVLPNNLNLNIDTVSQERKRGIFKVPVYTANAKQIFDFDLSTVETHIRSKDKINWEKAQLIIPMAQNKSIRGATKLLIDKKATELEPRNSKGGLISEIGDPRKLQTFELSLSFLGAQGLYATASARNTKIQINSDWAHPSFVGDYLPNERDISDSGFTATWEIPHFARAVPQISREIQENTLKKVANLGVRFYQPNDFYQQAYRVGRYGIMFIALTFLTILLLDRKSERPVHPIQYILIGLAQSMFVVLMVAFAEHFGFGAAYLIASAAVIGLITLFAFTGLKMGKVSWLVGAVLTLLYSVLYMILGSADYALLAGSVLSFGGIAATMLATRDQDWYRNTDAMKSFGTPPVFKSKADPTA